MRIRYNTVITNQLRASCENLANYSRDVDFVTDFGCISVTAHYEDPEKNLSFLVGFACIRPTRDMSRCGFDLYVRKSNRKNGIGQGLANIVMAMIEGEGMKPSVVAINSASAKIMKELGLVMDENGIWSK